MEINLKKRLQDGERLIGTWSDGGSASNVEILGLAGYDFVIIDNEHGRHSNPDMLHLIRAAEVSKIAPIIRVPGPDVEDPIKKALDMGASGVLVPNIRTREETERAVRFSKFRPIGRRGCCAYLRYNGYGDKYGTVDCYEKSNEEVMTILLFETCEALENIDDILSVPGIDSVFIGPLDLAVSLGCIGQMDNPQLEAACLHIAKKAREYGLKVGMFCDSDKMVLKWIDKLDYVTGGSDLSQLLTYGRQQVKLFRGAMKDSAGQ